MNPIKTKYKAEIEEIAKGAKLEQNYDVALEIAEKAFLVGYEAGKNEEYVRLTTRCSETP